MTQPTHPTNQAPGTIRTRIAQSQDAASIAPLFDQYRQFYGKASDLNGAITFLEHNLTQQSSALFYAVNETNEILGFTQLYPTFSSLSMRKAWILNDLFVIPEARSQGVARLLMEAARQHAAATGAKGLELATGADNQKAQRLYESLGYQRDDEFYHYYLNL